MASKSLRSEHPLYSVYDQINSIMFSLIQVMLNARVHKTKHEFIIYLENLRILYTWLYPLLDKKKIEYYNKLINDIDKYIDEEIEYNNHKKSIDESNKLLKLMHTLHTYLFNDLAFLNLYLQTSRRLTSDGGKNILIGDQKNITDPELDEMLNE